MINQIRKRLFIITLAVIFAMSLLIISTSAMGVRAGMDQGENNTLDSVLDDTTSDSASGDSNTNDSSGSDSTQNNTSDSTGAGTGEFGVDTSDNASNSANGADDTSRENALTNDSMNASDGIATDRDGIIDDGLDTEESTNNDMSIWGIVIAIIIIAAIAGLIAVFFTKKK